MKRVAISLLFIVLLASIVSADLILTQQPEDLYNLGEVIKVPAKVTAINSVNDFLSMRLICNGIETEIHKQYISLTAGEEQEVMAAIPLSTEFIGQSTGTCVVKAILGEVFILTDEFKISNIIIPTVTLERDYYLPGEQILIEGTAVKENGENVNGFVEASIIGLGETKLQVTDTVKNGYVFLNTSMPKNTPAGEYLVNLNIYEKESSGSVSNTGLANFNIVMGQVASSVELFFEEKPVMPGTNLRIMAILHDQTGEKIKSNAVITLINEKGKIIEQKDVKTEEYFEFPLLYNQPPVNWTVKAESNGLFAQENFNISENTAVNVEIINSTVIITNIGNVPYNNTALVKIGNETINLDVYLEVDEETKYYLSAPEGEYEIEVRAGEEKTSSMVMLTGGAIAAEEISNSFFGFIGVPLVWIFIIGVMGFMAYMLYKKGYKKTFFGYITNKIKRGEEKPITKDTNSLISPNNPAELSLSIKGNSQDVSLVCLKIRNESKLSDNDSAKDELNTLVHAAEDTKAVTYENQDNIFLIWTPARTRTYKNQKTAVEIAQKIKDTLTKYNQLAKDKIDFGLALNYGTMVVKDEKVLKFMSMGTLITNAKKLASISQGEIYLSEKMNEKVLADVKTEKHQKDSYQFHTIKEIKQRGDDNKKFIDSFIRRLETENKAKEKK